MPEEKLGFGEGDEHAMDALLVPLLVNALDPAVAADVASASWAEANARDAVDASFVAVMLARALLEMTGEVGGRALTPLRAELHVGFPGEQ